MSMMVQNMVTKAEIGKLQTVFMQLNKAQTGSLSQQELQEGYARYYGDELAKKEVEKIFKLVDVDNSGAIDFSEFVTATCDREVLLSETKLRQAFRYYDKDDGGSISLEELKEVLGVGQNITLEVWKVLVEEVDENGDGEIDFEEF